MSLGNLLGALFMAYFLGHYVGLSEGAASAKTIAIAEAKVQMDFGRAFVSAIACNWMVCMGDLVLFWRNKPPVVSSPYGSQ